MLEFFATAGRNLLAAEAAAGVGHHVALSVVGTDRLPDSGYLRAKIAQEKLIQASGIPFTIVRATQFFEFVDGIIDSGCRTGQVRICRPALLQPIASEDVAAVVAELTLVAPVTESSRLPGQKGIPSTRSSPAI